MKPIPDFVLSGDILLASYPRSGNTWMRYLLANLLFPDKKWHINNIAQVIPDLGEPFPDPYLAPSPRIFKTHFPRPVNSCRAIYIYRDGRDVALSFHDYRRKLRGEEVAFSDFLESMLTNGLKFGSWQSHVDSWMNAASGGSLLPVQYESMCRDLVAEMRRVAVFLGHTWSEPMILRAAERASREQIRKHMRWFRSRAYWRKGYSGGLNKGCGYWREAFDHKLQETFWHHAGETAARLGYSRY